jgi:hypothetical protein
MAVAVRLDRLHRLPLLPCRHHRPRQAITAPAQRSRRPGSKG